MERHAHRLIGTQLVGMGEDLKAHYARRWASVLPGSAMMPGARYRSH